jgi:hypothetical protein
MPKSFSRKARPLVLVSSLAFGALLTAASAHAQIARLELHAFQTQTPTQAFEQFSLTEEPHDLRDGPNLRRSVLETAVSSS